MDEDEQRIYLFVMHYSVFLSFFPCIGILSAVLRIKLILFWKNTKIKLWTRTVHLSKYQQQTSK